MSEKTELFLVLKNVTIFAGVKEDALRTLYNDCRIIDFKKGETIIREGEPATEIFIILKGRVRISLNIPQGPMELIELGPGHCVGESSVIGVQKHSATALVLEDASLMVLTRKVLMDLAQYDKDLFSLLILNIARELARRLHHTDAVILNNSIKNAIIGESDGSGV
jgi:CRP-like cAMP-binding protein